MSEDLHPVPRRWDGLRAYKHDNSRETCSNRAHNVDRTENYCTSGWVRGSRGWWPLLGETSCGVLWSSSVISVYSWMSSDRKIMWRTEGERGIVHNTEKFPPHSPLQHLRQTAPRTQPAFLISLLSLLTVATTGWDNHHTLTDIESPGLSYTWCQCHHPLCPA